MSPKLKGNSVLKVENNKTNLNGLEKEAYIFAEEAHKGQYRKSGELYFTHCEAVYKILKDEWGLKNEDCLVAALLHDTVEDTDVTLDQIKSKFGKKVKNLVSGVTKLKSSTDRETLKKFLNESYINPRVAIIKLADRLHNMRTLEFVEPEKQIEKSRETLDVYTKLAESLGIWSAKTELEDLGFKYLNPEKYQKTLAELKIDKRLSYDFIRNRTNEIKKLLSNNHIDGKVEIKKSGCWTLIKKQEKMALKGKCSLKSFKDINDVISIRIQLDCVEDCYQIVPKINSNFEGMVDYDRFDQFIGINKRVNGNQALQITINFPEGSVKIAIMTKEMEEFNKWGVISLINNNNKKDLEDYVLKLVFTPTENIRFLIKNATGVDFAGAISPRVLAEAESINIDGVNYPLSVVIPNASTVEVILGESRRAPSKGIGDSATMPETKKIIQELRILDEKDNFVKDGQKKLESILITRGLLVLTDVGDSINSIIYKFGCQGIDDLYFMLGNGSVEKKIINKELDSAGITKEKLKITSIRLRGPDKPKTLVYVLDKIDKNISIKDQSREDGDFVIRIIAENMSPDDEEKLRNSLSNDGRFSEVLVV